MHTHQHHILMHTHDIHINVERYASHICIAYMHTQTYRHTDDVCVYRSHSIQNQHCDLHRAPFTTERGDGNQHVLTRCVDELLVRRELGGWGSEGRPGGSERDGGRDLVGFVRGGRVAAHARGPSSLLFSRRDTRSAVVSRAEKKNSFSGGDVLPRYGQRERERGGCGFSSLMKQKKKMQNLLRNLHRRRKYFYFIYEVIMKQGGGEKALLSTTRSRTGPGVDASIRASGCEVGLRGREFIRDRNVLVGCSIWPLLGVTESESESERRPRALSLRERDARERERARSRETGREGGREGRREREREGGRD
jgi:hypothetical protein